MADHGLALVAGGQTARAAIALSAAVAEAAAGGDAEARRALAHLKLPLEATAAPRQ